MAFFALIILDNQANTVAIKPTGAEFQQPFLDKVAQEETQHDGPHPNVYDMGGYYLHSLWSGKKPFIIEPEYIVGVVSDASEDEAQIKRALRKITNNALLSLKESDAELRKAMELLWNQIESGSLDAIELEKPVPIAEPKEKPIPETDTYEDSFDDLLEMSDSLESSAGAENSDPFASSSSHSSTRSQGAAQTRAQTDLAKIKNAPTDPFGGSSREPATDPFGGSSTSGSSDPFGGSSGQTIQDPFGGSKPSIPNPPNEGGISGKTGDAFSENPWGEPENQPVKQNRAPSKDADPFSSNPFGSETQETPSASPDSDPFTSDPWAKDDSGNNKKESKKKDLDPFDDNPFA